MAPPATIPSASSTSNPPPAAGRQSTTRRPNRSVAPPRSATARCAAIASIRPNRPRLGLEDGDGVLGRLEDRPATVDLGGVEHLVTRARGRRRSPGPPRRSRCPAGPPYSPPVARQDRVPVSRSSASQRSQDAAASGTSQGSLVVGDPDHPRPAAGRAHRLAAAESLDAEDPEAAAAERGGSRRAVRPEPDDDRVERVQRGTLLGARAPNLSPASRRQPVEDQPLDALDAARAPGSSRRGRGP